MNKKISIIVIFLIIISILFSGCLEGSKSIDVHTRSYDNFYPVAIISAPNIAYFGETVEFDATKSYDSDGKIVLYTWIFGDGDTSDGKIVKHSFKVEDYFNIEYPLIYTVTLLIIDNNGAGTAKSHEVKIYPHSYIFYFYSQSLVIEKPSLDKDKIKASFRILNQNSMEIQSYELENPINISPCFWNVTLYLKKPWFTRLTKVKLIFYDSNNNQILNAERNFGFFRLWNKQTIRLEGKLNKKVEFQSIKLSIYGFSLGRKISILYGGNTPSNICFNFTN